jgi:hypothetical protein
MQLVLASRYRFECAMEWVTWAGELAARPLPKRTAPLPASGRQREIWLMQRKVGGEKLVGAQHALVFFLRGVQGLQPPPSAVVRQIGGG